MARLGRSRPAQPRIRPALLPGPAVTGTSAVTGTGGLAAAGVKGAPGSSQLPGAGTLTAAGVKAAAGPATLPGTGTLMAAGAKTASGASGITGGGTLAAAGPEYRLWPSTAGPSTADAYSGDFISGVNFTVTETGCWFEGYWWWVCGTGQSTSPVDCALWCVSQTTDDGSGNVLVPGTTVTSGTLTAGAWNWIPLATPVQLSPGYVAGMTGGTGAGSCYCAAVGVNGAFPDTAAYFGSGAPASGITSGPLYAYGSGSYAPPYGIPQGCYSTAGSDPAVTMPNVSSSGDNFWVDVQVTTVTPAGYSGSYRIWPNKFDTNTSTSADSAVAYVVATEINISEPVTLGYVHYFVPNGTDVAAGLATAADVWDITAGTAVASLASPSWTTESGGSVTLSGTYGQWVKAAFPPDTIIPAGNYRVSVYNANGGTGGWNAKDALTDYFWQGVGQDGLTWGPLTAPSQAAAQPADFYPGSGTGMTGGQPVFAYSGSDDFPHYTTGLNPAQVYWVDLEVTPAAFTGAVTGGGTLAGSGAKAASGLSAAAGADTLAASGAKAATGASSVTGGGLSVPAGSKAAAGSSSAAGTGLAAPAGARAAAGTGEVTGAGTAAGAAAAGRTGAGSLAGDGMPGGAGAKGAAGTSLIEGTGHLAASQTPGGTSSIPAAGTLAAAGAKAAAGTSGITGTGAPRGAGSKSAAGTTALSGTGLLAGTTSIIGTGAVPATGTLAGAGFKAATGSSAITGTGTAASAGVKAAAGVASLPGTGTTAPAGGRNTTGTATLTGAAAAAAAGVRGARGTSAVTGTGVPGGVPAPAVTGSSTITGGAVMTANRPPRNVLFTPGTARLPWTTGRARLPWTAGRARNG